MMKNMKNTPREIAVEMLNHIEAKGAFAEPLLDGFLLRDKIMNISDRRLLTQLVYGTLRMKGCLDWIIGQLYRGNFTLMELGIKNILRTAVYQIWFTERIPDFAIVDEAVKMTKNMHPAGSGLVNAILRNAIRGKNDIVYPDIEKEPALHISTVHSHPLWLVKKWLETFGVEETTAICRTNNEVPPYTLRVNRLKTTRNQLMDDLSGSGFDVKATLFSPDGLVISHPAVPLRETTLYKSGCLTVQDEASQLIAHVVAPKPGDAILDVCAGVGGKTTHLAELMENRGRIIALDISKGKIEALKKNAKRQGVTIIETQVGDASDEIANVSRESCDIVLVDAPCSGIGTMRRNPEIKWRLSDEDINKMVILQKMILKKAALYVKKGGRLVYCTCSTLPVENERIIGDFIARNRDFVRIHPPAAIHSFMVDNRGYLRTHPHRHQMDGFFGAVLVKEAERKKN